jgi:uncharacterized protein YidB (DUF937 family)
MGLLDSILGGGAAHPARGGMSPMTLALIGLLAYRTYQGKGKLADMLNRTGSPAGGDQSAGKAPETGGLGGVLGRILGGGSAGGLLSGGLADLLKQFQQNGHGDKAQSWVSTGQNQAVQPHELEQALGNERIEWLMRQTGMSREELVAGLSEQLPGFVDQLTPQGRVPSQEEANRMV